METISVRWGVNVEEGSENITLEELEVNSIEEWEELSKDEQKERLQTAIDDLPDRTCIIVLNWG